MSAQAFYLTIHYVDMESLRIPWKTGHPYDVTGYGHGVGMSQYGANVLAGEGKDYQEILKWYYTGVTIGPYTPKNLATA